MTDCYLCGARGECYPLAFMDVVKGVSYPIKVYHFVCMNCYRVEKSKGARA